MAFLSMLCQCPSLPFVSCGIESDVMWTVLVCRVDSFTDIFQYIERGSHSGHPLSASQARFPSTVSMASDEAEEDVIRPTSLCGGPSSAMSPAEWMMRAGRRPGMLGSRVFEEPCIQEACHENGWGFYMELEPTPMVG